uniref:Uncharacterized protein n=1 Tax=Chromera velia CCMP2878 TaxID=1169474 RepID=A0A0G4HKM2_9ALVE|eukprot:Cvel_7242.t1-p1 / transcript=Cvel_7242.t1 / gene=Cvel_7242 / organism=Chromera_velia_CCMP2878 / gene_product=hypothetical protein / transcript_product=hypothetical protein / location=Cvel_scaffold373:76659-83172(-) / protein_length=428 / sequence_SO=supercontig / SO=protein_coding / is_pseudo=false
MKTVAAFAFDVAQWPAAEKGWYKHTSSFLSFFSVGMAMAGFDLGKLGANAVTAFALDGEADPGLYREKVQRGLRRRGFEVEVRPYKCDGRQEAADTRLSCKALWEALQKATLFFLASGEAVRIVVGVLGVDADLKAIAETLEDALSVRGWLPAGCEVHVVMMGTRAKAPKTVGKRWEDLREKLKKVRLHVSYVEEAPEVEMVFSGNQSVWNPSAIVRRNTTTEKQRDDADKEFDSQASRTLKFLPTDDKRFVIQECKALDVEGTGYVRTADVADLLYLRRKMTEGEVFESTADQISEWVPYATILGATVPPKTPEETIKTPQELYMENQALKEDNEKKKRKLSELEASLAEAERKLETFSHESEPGYNQLDGCNQSERRNKRQRFHVDEEGEDSAAIVPPSQTDASTSTSSTSFGSLSSFPSGEQTPL